MLKYIRTGVLINQRSFSSLRVNQKPRFIYPTENLLSGGSLSLSRNVSTLESLYSKVISLPPVHYIEDSLAYIHDTTGESFYPLYPLGFLADVFRFTMVGLADTVHWLVPSDPDPACSYNPAEGERQEISDESGDEE